MYIITTVFGYLASFILLNLILILVLLNSLAGNQRLLDPVIKMLSRLIPRTFGIRVKPRGRDKPDRDKTYIFMANHINFLDVFILYGYIPHFIRAVELEDHFSWPLWGAITRKMGNIPISHKNTEQALQSLNLARDAISEGISIAILPEGHRTRDGKLQTFMRGPFRLAVNARTEILPIVMKGLWERKSVRSKWVRPGPVELVFGEPISVEISSGKTERELRDYIRNIFLNMLD